MSCIPSWVQFIHLCNLCTSIKHCYTNIVHAYTAWNVYFQKYLVCVCVHILCIYCTCVYCMECISTRLFPVHVYICRLLKCIYFELEPCESWSQISGFFLQLSGKTAIKIGFGFRLFFYKFFYSVPNAFFVYLNMIYMIYNYCTHVLSIVS